MISLAEVDLDEYPLRSINILFQVDDSEPFLVHAIVVQGGQCRWGQIGVSIVRYGLSWLWKAKRRCLSNERQCCRVDDAGAAAA